MIHINIEVAPHADGRQGVSYDIWERIQITPDCHKWLLDNLNEKEWSWTANPDAFSTIFSFKNISDALRFKLTWL
jgi:hypothetical protein